MLDFPIQFFDRFQTSDWIQFALLVVAFITLGSAAISLRQQSRAADFTAYMALTEKHNAAWRRFRAAPEADKEYECAEILNLIEGTCHLYNARVLRGATRDVIRDYLKETIEAVFSNEFAKSVIEKSLSGPDTFFHIRRFAAKENLEGIPQQ